MQHTNAPKAKVIAHSASALTGKEVVTFEVEFWRGVLAEFNTHNALSKNTSSSRAIPVPTMLKTIRDTPGMPFRFGAANKGMQDSGEHNQEVVFQASDEEGNQIVLPPVEAWKYCIDVVTSLSEAWHDAGYAKQISNRVSELGQTVKVVVTATDLANFFWLRDHPMADPTIEALAIAMKKAYKESKPTKLFPGEWHVPYYNDGVWKPHKELEVHPVIVVDVFGHSLQNALDISASCCAQASYRSLDDTLEKARSVVERLNLGVDLTEPCHASPTEHQATPVGPSAFFSKDCDVTDGVNLLHPCTWEEGITHITREGTLCSGNLKGFIQHRQLIPGNVYTGDF